MKLILRGHIRTSFENKHLYNFVKDCLTFCSLKKEPFQIYIHTWNVVQSSGSWRSMYEIPDKINEKKVYDYFGELWKYIEHIIVDDEKKIELIGRLDGNVGRGECPIKNWKNYWYGKYKIIDYLYNNFNDNCENKCFSKEWIINTRFDVFNNSFSLSNNVLIDFIYNNFDDEVFNQEITKKNKFIFDVFSFGIDNFYVGTIEPMYNMTKLFYLFLDEMNKEKTFENTFSQEFLVYHVNEDLDNYIEKYLNGEILIKKTINVVEKQKINVIEKQKINISEPIKEIYEPIKETYEPIKEVKEDSYGESSFDPSIYRLLNPDLSHLDDYSIKNHFLQNAKKECRNYQLSIPDDFSPETYRYLNPDLKHMKDTECKIHYHSHGKKEKRSYKADLPNGFDPVSYKNKNGDLQNMNEQELIAHYLNHGRHEKREY